MSVIDDLCGSANVRKRKLSEGASVPFCPVPNELHVIQPLGRRATRICAICRISRPSYECAVCDVALHAACFHSYHEALSNGGT